jgi:hypothetical protein
VRLLSYQAFTSKIVSNSIGVTPRRDSGPRHALDAS